MLTLRIVFHNSQELDKALQKFYVDVRNFVMLVINNFHTMLLVQLRINSTRDVLLN